MPLAGQRLQIHPRFPKAAELSAIGAPEPRDADDEESHLHLRGRFYSDRKRGDVVTFLDDRTGRVDWGIERPRGRAAMELDLLDASSAWGIEQEARAVRLLGTLINHHQFKTYLLTGMFVEQSRRSKVSYVFRKLRPTIALSTCEPIRLLAALCLHPIAYYAGSWAGAMTPTDDVVAHLMLMRGDEPLFWKRANQHAPWRPEAGL